MTRTVAEYPVDDRAVGGGLVAATGHYRSGVLLAPITADAVAGMVTTGRIPGEIAGLSPQWFRRVEGMGA